MNPDWAEMLSVLSEAGAEFLVVGAHALAAHGHPRSTGDLDIWVRPTTENAHRVWSALVRFGAPLRGLGPEDLAVPEVVFQIGIPPRRIDVLTSISGVDFDAAWPHRVTMVIGSRAVSFIGRDDLLANKRAAGRPKDLADAALLEQE